jgi:hypothetical protein
MPFTCAEFRQMVYMDTPRGVRTWPRCSASGNSGQPRRNIPEGSFQSPIIGSIDRMQQYWGTRNDLALDPSEGKLHLAHPQGFPVSS